jgi:hypothetical protein
LIIFSFSESRFNKYIPLAFQGYIDLKIHLESHLEDIGASVFDDYHSTVRCCERPPVFHIGIDVVEHETVVRIPIPVEAEGKIVLLSAFNIRDAGEILTYGRQMPKRSFPLPFSAILN